MRPIFETEMLIHQSKANLNVKILFSNNTHLIDPEIRKCWKTVCLGTKIPLSILAHDLLAIETKILFLTLIITLNLNFDAI